MSDIQEQIKLSHKRAEENDRKIYDGLVNDYKILVQNWKEKYYQMKDERDKQKEVLDKIKEYIEKELLPSHNIKTTDWEYEEVICSDLPVENIKPIVELLEEIE